MYIVIVQCNYVYDVYKYIIYKYTQKREKLTMALKVVAATCAQRSFPLFRKLETVASRGVKEQRAFSRYKDDGDMHFGGIRQYAR